VRGRSAITLVAALVASVGVSHAAPSARASLERTQIELGETVELVVEVTGVQNAPPPHVPVPEGLQAGYLGQSTRVAITNGQMAASATHTYQLMARKPGTFTVGPITVAVAGTTYDAGTVSLQVTAAGRGTAVDPGAGQLRLELSAPTTEVFIGQRVPLRLRLTIGNVRVADLKYPTIAGDGFALEKFPEPTQRQEETPQGLVHVVEFTTTLTALRSGSLTVGPAVIGMSLLERRRSGSDPFDGLFGTDPFATRRPIEVRSDPVLLTVLSLPDAGRPVDFSGGVGRFEIDVQAAPLEMSVGDPVTLTFTIRGPGNLDQVAAPSVPAGDDLRVYPAQAGTAAEGAAGATRKVFEQVVIPQRAGPFTLPPIRFSYFDPDARAYRTVEKPSLVLTVREGATPRTAPAIVGGTTATVRPTAEPLGRDLVSIKDEPGTLRPIGTRLRRSILFWLVQPLPALLWLAALVYDRRRTRLHADPRLVRFTRAGRAARAALAGAESALARGDRPIFFDQVARSVSEYLSAKLDLPPGAVSAAAVAERLRMRGLDGVVASDLEALLAACERARFAPGSGDGDMRQTLARAQSVIRRLERARRLTPIAGAAVLLAALAFADAGETPNTLFFQGGALYAEGRYADAASLYEGIRSAGRESGALYFNLGNAYFKAGDTGRAILTYERARRVLPRDPAVPANLAFARALTDPPLDQPLWARLVFPLAGRMTSDELLGVAAVTQTILFLGLATARLGRRTVPIALRLGGGIVVAVALSSAVYRLVRVDLPHFAVVTTDATVRFEPSPAGTAHFAARPGAMLRVLGQRDQWLQVARGDGARGWVQRDAVEDL